jgi:adenylate cyclase
MSPPFQRIRIRWLTLGLAGSLAILLQWMQPASGLAWDLDHIVKDRLILTNASSESESRIVVIDIDESSIAAIAPWPWERSTIADLVEALVADYGVKAVGLDIVFPSEADSLGDLRLAALSQTAPVTLSQVFDFSTREESISSGVVIMQDLSPDFSPLILGSIPRATGYIANHVGLKDAKCVGNIGIRPDPDGRVRTVPLWTHWQDGTSPLLPLAMLWCGHEREGTEKAEIQATLSKLQPEWTVPYSHKWQSYTVIPARDILQRNIDPQWLADRWVLVGSSALGLNDRVTTPLGTGAAGVMVHAAVLTALLDLALSPKPEIWAPLGKTLASIWIIFSLTTSAWLLGRSRAWSLVPVTAAWVTGWLFLAAWCIREQLSISAVSPLIASTVVFLLIPFEWWLTQRSEGRLLKTFSNYVAPSVLQQMLKQGVDQPLVPRYCDITVLSADMQSYSALTAISSLEDTALLTREFLQCLTAPLLTHEGTLDKYTGDGLVAFWGAPIAMPNQTDKAIAAALQMIQEVNAWNMVRQLQGKPMVRVRIGIESGDALVGDLGTSFRSTYTAVGDCINSASKFQNAAKHYNHDLIIGARAAQWAKDFDLKEIGTMTLSGHNQPTRLFTPVNTAKSLPQEPTQSTGQMPNVT